MTKYRVIEHRFDDRKIMCVHTVYAADRMAAVSKVFTDEKFDFTCYTGGAYSRTHGHRVFAKVQEVEPR